MIVQTLVDEMATEFGEESSDLDVQSQFHQYVQEVFDEIVMSGRWWHQNVTHTITLVDTTYIYDLPVTISEIREVRHRGLAKRVAQTTIEQMTRRGYDLEKTAALPPGPDHEPTHWYVSGADGTTGAIEIGVWPVPNGDQTDVLDVYGLKRPAALGLADTIPLPEEYISVMRSGVRGLVRYGENNLEAAQLMFARFDGKLRLLNARFNGVPRAGSSLAAKRGLQITAQMPSAPGAD